LNNREFPSQLVGNGISIDTIGDTTVIRQEFDSLLSEGISSVLELDDAPLSSTSLFNTGPRNLQYLFNSQRKTYVTLRDGVIYFAAILPIVPVNNQFNHFIIHRTPVATERYTGTPRWKQVIGNAKILLTNNQTITVTTEDHLNCDDILNNWPCQVCFLDETLEKATDEQCVITDFQDFQRGKLDSEHTNCKTEEIPNDDVKEKAFPLSPHSWIYSDPTPGSLTETCVSHQSTVDLPRQGLINFREGCAYNMVNGPFHFPMPHIPGIKMLSTISQKTAETTRNLIDDLNTIQRHFKDHGYIYLIVLASLVFLISIFVCYICCARFFYNRRYRIRRSISTVVQRPPRRPRRPMIIDEEEDEIPMRPIFPSLPFFRTVPGGVEIV
jgi:hypothetical protein